MATYSILPTPNQSTTAYTRQYGFRQAPTLPLRSTPNSVSGRLILGDTSAKLQEGRDSRLYSMLLQEFAQKQSYFPGVTKEAVLTLATQLLASVRPLGVRTVVLGLTYDQGLNLRAELEDELGTLHVEVAIGPDADADEDTFVSLRHAGSERWGASGALRALLPRLAELKLVTEAR
ncbi:hypothetical protein [Hymenobacter baengnokdamensis]|uniref:hypothetical protein n=1 Tax=Hymenobacter baengnokdamensis TaxID=2615203 RepID=UPI0012459F3D|nr:hypothetical protein [Hymenobacter baengnokdamensis]